MSDLSAPENRYERSQKKLLEVYLPIRTPNGQRLLFEAYFRYGAVSAAGSRIWRSFAPISLGALIVLELVQIPLAWSLARRLRQRQREREALLRQALDASDLERGASPISTTVSCRTSRASRTRSRARPANPTCRPRPPASSNAPRLACAPA